MEELSKPPIATLEIKEKEVKSDEYLKKVHEFTEKLKTHAKIFEATHTLNCKSSHGQ